VTLFLLSLGVTILVRFAGKTIPVPLVSRLRQRTIAPLGTVAGFFDASGGGGWGPINMSVLMARLPVEPRKVVGSVNASEATVTIAASAGFVLALGWGGIPWTWVLALMAGGMAAAPFAAWFARHIPAYLLGVLVGGVLLVTNTRTMALALGASTSVLLMSIGVVAALCAVVALAAMFRHRLPGPLAPQHEGAK
jgi:uncharacterized protein